MNKGQNSTKTANGIAGNVKTSRKICSISLKTISQKQYRNKRKNPMWHRGDCPSARSLSIPPKEVQPLAAYH